MEMSSLSSVSTPSPTPKAISATTLPSALAPERIADKPDRESGRGNDAFFADDNLPYVIGSVTIACIIMAMVVAIVLWRKGRPRRRLSICDVEINRRKWAEGCLEEFRTRTQAPKTKKKDNKHKKMRSDWVTTNHPSAPALQLVPIGSAPDIVTAHDSDSIYETVDERRTVCAKTSQVTPENRHLCDSDVETAARESRPVSAHADESAYDHFGRFRNQISQQLPARSPRDRRKDLQDDTRPPLPPKSRDFHDPDGLKMKTKSLGMIPSKDKGSRVSCVLSSSDSLNKALMELGLQNCSSRAPIVCQITVLEVMDNGKPASVEQLAASNNALFVLEPGEDDIALKSSEDFDVLKSSRSYKVLNSPTASHVPIYSLASNVLKSSMGSTAEFCIKDDGIRENKKGCGEACRQGCFILESATQQKEPPQKKTTIPPSLPQPSLNSRRRATGVNANYCSGRRCSLPSHQTDCPRPAVRRLSENPATLQAFRNSSINSLPNFSSTEHWGISPSPSVDYVRSFSSPQPSKSKPDGLEAPSAREGKLDAALLKARIQREMHALGFFDKDDSRNPETGTSATRAEPSPIFHGQDTGSVMRPSTNEYFILEPESEASDDNDDANDSRHGSRVLLPSTPPLSIRPSSQSRLNLIYTDPRGRPIHFQRQQTIAGLPPRLPHRSPRMRGHNRSRSETPVFQSSQPQPCLEGEEDEEEGPVVVSLKKFKPLDTGDRAVPLSREQSTDIPQRRSFRPRIMSEPCYS